jgi:hypothetical protein
MRIQEESAEARLSKRAIGVAAWRDSPVRKSYSACLAITAIKTARAAMRRSPAQPRPRTTGERWPRDAPNRR